MTQFIFCLETFKFEFSKKKGSQEGAYKYTGQQTSIKAESGRSF